jgi:catechol 2,3-dioxygenase-like lactoylglutathione lyase family enzyme
MERSRAPNPLHAGLVRLNREDPYLRLQSVTIYVRDQDVSLRFYADQLGFRVAYDVMIQPGFRVVAVAPPDGESVLALIAPAPDSEEYKLIGHAADVAFITEDVTAKFNQWSERGVRFLHPPKKETWAATSPYLKIRMRTVLRLLASII